VVKNSPKSLHPIIGKWTWKESINIDNVSNFSTPKSRGFRTKIVFTDDGKVITYKNDIELRINKYTMNRGISVFDQKEYDLITFEGITYVIEKLDRSNLTLVRNFSEGYRLKFNK